MLYKNNIGPQVRRKRYALGWSQSTLAAKLQIAGLDISRSGVSKIEAKASLRGRQDHHVPRGSSESPCAGTLPSSRERGAYLGVHGETRNDTVLIGAFRYR